MVSMMVAMVVVVMLVALLVEQLGEDSRGQEKFYAMVVVVVASCHGCGEEDVSGQDAGCHQ